MIILTQRYDAIPLRNGCIKLVETTPLLLAERCTGRYLVLKRGDGIYTSNRPVSETNLVFYIAAGLPRRVRYIDSVVKIEEGFDLFQGLTKRGLWREIAPSFYAAVSAYAARCTYCTAYIEVESKRRPQQIKDSRVIIEVAGLAGRYRAVVVSPPGRSDVFKDAVIKLFDNADVIHMVKLGAAVDVPLDLYLPAHVITYRVAPAPTLLTARNG
ncbi:hypothetical protein [Pyrobaculum islandicum]|nr:hypothetical protein [Pyrobaculum islandicum]